MNRDGNDITCKSIPLDLLTTEELRKFNHHVRRNRGELLFAQFWLLVEGETEVSVFIECADILGINLYRHGIRVIEYSQVDQNIFMKVADALGIRWFLLADGDQEGQRYYRSAENHLNGRISDDYIKLLSYENIEVLLCNNGYGQPYIDRIGPQQEGRVTEAPNTPNYWQQVCQIVKNKSKPAAALDAILLMKEQGAEGVPTEIKNILEKISTLMGGDR